MSIFVSQQKGNDMQKNSIGFIILVVFTNFLFSQYSSSTPTPYMNVGLMMNPNGFEMGMYFIPKSENKTLFKFTGGYGWFAGQDGSGSYEDYTEVFGTVNTFDDRFDGEFSISNYLGLGGYFFTPLSENRKTFLLHQIGIITFSESFYNKYYDSFEILGNNGKYYSESSTPDKSSFGFEFGSNFYFSLSQTPNYNGRYFWYGYVGGSLSTVDSFTIRGGIGVSFL